MTVERHDLTLCADILARKSRSFRLASLLLSPEVRSATVVLYAFCRRCDDAVDEGEQGAAHKQRAVERLRAELTSVYQGEAQTDPVLAAFQQVVMRHGIPRLYPEELIEGMHMDARGSHYHTLDDLLLYCHRAAGTVGLMMCHVLGVRDARALRHAAHLGIAMQLTNICRDVLEDFRLGRVYLPAQMLALAGAGALHVGAREQELEVPDTRAAIAKVVRRLLDEADSYYRSGDLGLRYLPFRSSLSVRTARRLYAAIGTRLRFWGCDALRGRAFTPGSWKAWLLLRALFSSVLSAPLRLVASRARPTLLLQREVRFPDDVLPL